ELQRKVLVDVRDRKQVFEDPFESDVLAFVGRGIRLQQRLEGACLDVEQMRHVLLGLELREGNRRKCVRHVSPGWYRQAKKRARPRSTSSRWTARELTDCVC